MLSALAESSQLRSCHCLPLRTIGSGGIHSFSFVDIAKCPVFAHMLLDVRRLSTNVRFPMRGMRPTLLVKVGVANDLSLQALCT